MPWKETHTADNYHQGLKIGSVATFIKDGNKYLKDGWEEIPVRCVVTGFRYPFIVTSHGTFHYSRYKPDKQLSLF